jgi:hypothetical protein
MFYGELWCCTERWGVVLRDEADGENEVLYGEMGCCMER